MKNLNLKNGFLKNCLKNTKYGISFCNSFKYNNINSFIKEYNTSSLNIKSNREINRYISKNERYYSSVASDNRVAFPSVKRLLEEYKLDNKLIKGTGPKGRLTKGDVLIFIESKNLKPVPKSTPVASAFSQETKKTVIVPSSQKTSHTDLKVSTMRTVIASRLTESKTKIPHFYATADCDITELMALRQEFSKKYNIKFSLNDMIISSCALSLQKLPQCNVFWDPKTQSVLQNKSVDISVAVAIEAGLITPIIKNANHKRIQEISSEMKSLAGKAKEGKLLPQEYQGGSFTISNLGMFGIDEFSAVINPPQAMIMAVSSGREVLVFEKGEYKNSTKMKVTISADSRAVNEDTVSRFLETFQNFISNPTLML
eukprot:TRINITY_DN4321_c1_g2_i1.p1 TRINITY_DN4321_c1_g2~~TRINITY_DN4321_c1_g2_i1.p1  ORF type:complete len:371 (-),score=92.25 TRINITY_DN4321_c1_g2_i1:51-1163(-)